MFSNFAENTGIRLNGVDPAAEDAAVPALRSASTRATRPAHWLNPAGLIPTLLARGMKVKVGDSVVLVVTNASGSVNGKTFIVGGVLRHHRPRWTRRLHPHQRHVSCCAWTRRK